MSSILLADREETRFRSLMDLTYRKVYNMAFRLVGNRSDAEDLTQEAFVRAYRKFSDYEGDKPFENWIFRIVTRLFLDLLRSRRRRIQPSSLDAPFQREAGDDMMHMDVADVRPTPEQAILDGTYNEDLQRVLDSLSPEQRLLIQLADVEEVPYQEIADMLDKPVGTIRSRLHRTHKQMRQQMEKHRDARQNRKGCCGGKLCPSCG